MPNTYHIPETNLGWHETDHTVNSNQQYNQVLKKQHCPGRRNKKA